MTKPTAIECDVDFPDDCLWEDDSVIRPGGLALAGALAALFEDADMRVSKPKMDLEHVSWDLDVDWRGQHFRLQVLQLGTCLIVVHGGPSLLARLVVRRSPERADLAEHIWSVLAGDPRFGAIRWYRV